MQYRATSKIKLLNSASPECMNSIKTKKSLTSRVLYGASTYELMNYTFISPNSRGGRKNNTVQTLIMIHTQQQQ